MQAVAQLMRQYQSLEHAQIDALEAVSGVSPQPLSFEETISGAMQRAKNTVPGYDLSFGIASGLLAVPHTQTGYMNICACAIYDGADYYIGLSSAFECPLQITDLMVNGGLDMNQAFNKVGLSTNKNLGASEGAIDILSNGRMLLYTQQAVIMALVRWENRAIFEQY